MILTLDFSCDVPIYLQIRNQIVKAMGNGQLADGERLPAVRALAEEAGINSMTVNKAYQMLKQEGYIITDRRNGATVHFQNKGKPVIRREIKEKLELIVAEAKAGGMKQEDMIDILKEMYGEECENTDK